MSSHAGFLDACPAAGADCAETNTFNCNFGGLGEYGLPHRMWKFAEAAADPDLDGILRVEYRGCRYALGYSACPDLEDRARVTDLLRSERIGAKLSEECQLVPEQSTDAIVVRHPDANFFGAA